MSECQYKVVMEMIINLTALFSFLEAKDHAKIGDDF